MSVRTLVFAFATVACIEASVLAPGFSTAQQLAETAAATSIHGQLQSTQNTKAGLHGVNTARALQKNSNNQLAYGNQAFGDGKTAVQSQSSGQSAKSQGSVDAADAAAFDAGHPVLGKTYRTNGIVVFDGNVNKSRVIFLIQLDSPNHYQVLGFRPHDPSIPQFAPQTQVDVTAVYAAKIKEPQTGSMVHGFDDAVFQAGTSAPGSPNAGAQQPEQKDAKPTFDSVLKGWSFHGTVQVDGETTGVFTSEKEIKYAHPGTKLSDDVKVANLENGKAKLVVAGQKVEVAPW